MLCSAYMTGERRNKLYFNLSTIMKLLSGAWTCYVSVRSMKMMLFAGKTSWRMKRHGVGKQWRDEIHHSWNNGARNDS